MDTRDPIDRAKEAWLEGYAIIASAVNKLLDELSIDLRLESPEPKGADLVQCRLRLTDALIDIPNLPRRITRDVEGQEWRPWFVGYVNGDANESYGWIGCAYVPYPGGREPDATVSFLRKSKPLWTAGDWNSQIIQPMENGRLKFEQWMQEIRDSCVPKTDAPIFLGQGRVQVGEEVFSLDAACADVLQALVELRSATKQQLIDRSGVEDAHQVLKRIPTAIPQLAPFIRLPGKRGVGGYGTTIRHPFPEH